jgi:hypothetical protein
MGGVATPCSDIIGLARLKAEAQCTDARHDFFFELKQRVMLTGKRFRLEIQTMAIDTVEGKRLAVTIPAGEIIKVISGPRHGERMMDVLWDGRVVQMFAADVSERGTEIAEKAV